MTVDHYLSMVLDEAGSLRHYHHVDIGDGETEIRWRATFLAAIDAYFAGVACHYSPASEREFEEFCAFADGTLPLAEYVALDKQLYELLDSKNILKMECCNG